MSVPSSSSSPRNIEPSSSLLKPSSFVVLHRGEQKLTSNTIFAKVADIEITAGYGESGESALDLPLLGDQGRRKSWEFHHLLKIQQEQLNALHQAQHRLDQIADHKGSLFKY